MELGFETPKDYLEVLVVPLAAALVALIWQVAAAYRRRRNFEELIRTEIRVAAPECKDGENEAVPPPWHTYLTRRFLHEDIIGQPVANAEFILSLQPALAYNLSQLWISFGKAQEARDWDTRMMQERASEFCFHLGGTAVYLDRKYGGSLVTEVWVKWVVLVKKMYPDVEPDIDLDPLSKWPPGQYWHVKRELKRAKLTIEKETRGALPKTGIAAGRRPATSDGGKVPGTHDGAHD